MISKRIIDRLLRQIKVGSIRVVYWDGESISYGIGKPDVSVTFHSPSSVKAILKNPSLGLGEGYMNGQVDIDGPIDLLVKLYINNKTVFKQFSFKVIPNRRARNKTKKQKQQIQHHYDLGNDFYKLWLDKAMVYSCAYYKSPKDSLETAQQQKLNHVLKKLQISNGNTLLDIGCGWGDLVIKAANEYGVHATGITLSEEQHAHAVARAKKEGLADKVKIHLLNYQDAAKRNWKFDRIVSVGMFEHVGRGNHAQYFDAIDTMLKKDGITLLHTITEQNALLTDPWIDKYIFPGGYIPSVVETLRPAVERNLRFVDYENLRIHYAMTLDEWLRRFEANVHKIQGMFDERFVRMWRFYLAACSGGFRYGEIALSQFVFTKGVNNNLPLTRDFLYK